jgi:MFS family permease
VLLNRIAVKTAFFINGFVLANWVSRLPRIQELYHADNGTIGTVLLSESIGAVIAMPFTGWIIIRNGSRKITLTAAILYSAVVVAIPFMPSLIALMMLYFVMGVITGILDVAMNAQAVMVEQQYKKPIMTSFHAFFSIGMALGAWSGAFFSELGVDLSRHFLIVSSGMVIITLLWMRTNLVHDKPSSLLSVGEPLFRLPSAALISIGIITFCCMLGEGAMANWSVNYMENIVKSTKTMAPIALSAFATSMTIGRIFGDKVRTKLGDKKLIVIGGMLALSGILFAILLPFDYTAIAGFFFVGLGLSTIVPIAYSIAGNTKGLPHGVGLAMVTTVGYSGFLFGPPLIGFIADWSSLRFSLMVVAGLFLTMIVLGLRYKSSPQ